MPPRPIASLCDTPTFGLPKWLYQRLCLLTKDSEWTVKSTEEFLTCIKHLEVEADEVMVSFEVISLFTSIPPALAIDTTDGFLREKYDETDQQLKRAHIIELLELCLKGFFTFNGQVYEQKKATPMGSPPSGLTAEAVLQRLEQLTKKLRRQLRDPSTSSLSVHLRITEIFEMASRMRQARGRQRESIALSGSNPGKSVANIFRHRSSSKRGHELPPLLNDNKVFLTDDTDKAELFSAFFAKHLATESDPVPFVRSLSDRTLSTIDVSSDLTKKHIIV
ncbi:hypothetical protein SprV_0100011200 [Sparganum proliferum]